jgi:hypothetical protein
MQMLHPRTGLGQATGGRRHLADYDLTERFKRSDVLMLITQVKNRIEDFINLPSSTEKRFFLACLWAWKDLANR